MADISVENGRLNEQFFDFEVYPEWWCCVIGKYPKSDDIPESIKDNFIVVTSDDSSAREKLLSVMCNPEWVNMGYNIKRYDNIILNGISNSFTPEQLRIISDIIIDPDRQYESVEAMRLAPFARKQYSGANYIYQDLLDDNTGSLKDKECCMQLDIRETTIPFDKRNLTQSEKDEIISYCKHDVWSSMQFYKMVLKPFIATKLLVGKVFGIPVPDCYKSTNATLSGRVLNARKTQFKDALREDIVIPEKVRDYIRYSLPKTIIDRLCASRAKFDVELFGNTVSYANGGIHSIPIRPKDIPRKTDNWCLQVISEDGWTLINADAGSFYPAMMISFNLLSRAVSKPEMFREMYESRLAFKKVIGPFEDKWTKIGMDKAPKEEYEYYKKCKETSQAYKLILNTTYGASGNKYLALSDPYRTTTVCRVGQLLLTSLVNNIYNQVGKDNVQVVQTNTDGVLLYIREEKLELLNEICNEFTRVTDILLELEREEIIWQRDVSDYILYKRNGKEKSKGSFFVTDMIQPGYNRVRPLNCYVCRDAMKWYLKERRDIVEHIYNETDISKFVITCSKGTAREIFQEFNDGRPIQMLHRCNRAIASLDESLGEIKLNYYRLGKKTTKKSPGCPPHCELINASLDNYDFEYYRDNKIDYMWYIDNTIRMLSDHWYEMKGNKIIPIKIYEE